MRVRFRQIVLGVSLGLAALAGASLGCADANATRMPPAKRADWTVMVYLNGKNDLEQGALDSFEQIAAEGSTHRVNYLVTLGRPRHHTSADESWSGVRRFRVTKGMKYTDPPLDDLGSSGELADMGRPEALEAFLTWSRANYPASHYLLIIWNHGQGWRKRSPTAPDIAGDRAATIDLNKAQLRRATVSSSTVQPEVPGGFRLVSFDDDTKNALYNRQIQSVLERAAKDGMIDVLGFDACLMGMIEVAYAMRKGAKYLVASEDIESYSWAYGSWIRRLNAKPTMSPLHVAKMLVKTYVAQVATYPGANVYRDHTMLSAIDLERVSHASTLLSEFAARLAEDIDAQHAVLAAARAKQLAFGSWYRHYFNTSIDLLDFLGKLEATLTRPSLRALAAQTAAAVKSMVVENSASPKMMSEGYGGLGVAIYLPESPEAFAADQYHDGYLPENQVEPVQFVEENAWASLVLRYLGLRP